jgi:hypothetical protein
VKKAIWAVPILAISVFAWRFSAAKPQSTNKVSLPQTVVIGNEYQSAGGCQDTGRDVRVGIPNHEYLDLAYKDPHFGIASVSLRETNKVGNSGVRNVAFDPNPGVLSFQIFAGGGGTVQCIPLVGCSCVGASGGSYGVEVTAHYKTNTHFSVE